MHIQTTENQYRRMLANGALRSRRLFETASCATVLREAARSVRQREAVQKAWEALAEREWLDCARVASMVDGVATIECGDPVQRELIRRQAAGLLRDMKLKVKVLRGLRIGCATENRRDVGFTPDVKRFDDCD